MSNEIVGERIKERREHLGLNQEQLALKLNYKDKSAISKIENGLRDLTQKKIRMFAEVLLTTPSYLMGWTNDPRDYAEILDSYGLEIPDDFLPGEEQDFRAREYLRAYEANLEVLKDYINAIDQEPKSILHDDFREKSTKLYVAYKNAPEHVQMAVCSLLGIDLINQEEK